MTFVAQTQRLSENVLTIVSSFYNPLENMSVNIRQRNLFWSKVTDAKVQLTTVSCLIPNQVMFLRDMDSF